MVRSTDQEMIAIEKIAHEKDTCRDFPGGSVVENLPSSAGDAGSIPGWGAKIPHAMGKLSLRAATEDPACRKEDPVCRS